jgi:CRISPR-associated protein Csm5
MSSQKLHTWKVKLETLSPLFIGSGKAISPYSDFIIQKTGGASEIHFLDHKRIEQAVSTKPELVDAYVTAIRKEMNGKGTGATLQDFITARLKLPLESVTLRRLPLHGDIKNQQLRQFISTAGRPFVPGSSLKGAFKTAVLYDWMMNTKEGVKIKDELVSLSNEVQKFKDERESFREKKEYKEADELQIKIKQKEKDLNLLDPLIKCFGKISEDDFRFLRISDSALFSENELQALEIGRISIEGKAKNTIPQPSECIALGAKTEFEITITENTSRRFPFLKNNALNGLFKLIKAFSYESVLMELGSLEENRDVKDLFVFYESLEDELNILKPNETILRLGGGKTYFDNSIGLAVDDDEDGEHLENFLLAIGMPKYSGGNFPKTRTAALTHNRTTAPLGWVKLTIQNHA